MVIKNNTMNHKIIQVVYLQQVILPNKSSVTIHTFGVQAPKEHMPGNVCQVNICTQILKASPFL